MASEVKQGNAGMRQAFLWKSGRFSKIPPLFEFGQMPRSYFGELEWRSNNCKKPFLFRDTILKMMHHQVLNTKSSLQGMRLHNTFGQIDTWTDR
jgi:hypothetical protein